MSNTSSQLEVATRIIEPNFSLDVNKVSINSYCNYLDYLQYLIW